MNVSPILVYLMASPSSYPCTYLGTRLGVTATVVRLDDTNANLTLRAGPLHIGQGSATISSDGALSFDKKFKRMLCARGVSMLDVVPGDEVIDVLTRVRFLGDVPIRLLRVRTAHR